MTRHIMLSFMSPYKDNGKQVEDSSYYGPGGFNTYGIQTNEPALLYILSLYELDKYYFFCSKKVQESLSYDANGDKRTDKMSHVDYFSSRMSERYNGFSEIMEPLLYDEESVSEALPFTRPNAESIVDRSDLLSVQNMARTVKEYALPLIAAGEEVVMHVDMTGGFRHASMLMLAVVGLLKYSGIKVGKVLYTNYDFERKKGKIEEVTETHNIMQLIAGAEAFVAYGSVDVLKKYFGKKTVSVELQELLLEMASFSDSLKLCRTGFIESNIVRLGEAIEKYDGAETSSLEEKLFKELLERIKLEYASLIGKHNRLDIILWCISKGFMQQALTFYTEWVPEILVSSGILQPGSDIVQKECIEEAPDYVSWEKYLIINYSSSAASAKLDTVSCIDCMREYFRKGQVSEKERAIRMLQAAGIDASSIFYELSCNDIVAADLKRNAITVSEIKEKYPKLYYAIDRIYHGNAKTPPKASFEEYWCESLTNNKVYKTIAGFKKEWLKKLFEMDALDADKCDSDALSHVDKKNSADFQDRKTIMESLFERGFINSSVPKELALNIAGEYNAIRIIRNNCNHAKEGSDIPPIDKIKDMLIRYIGHIRYAMKEASHGRN